MVVTLVYLAVQVRHSRQATEANTRQMRGNAMVEMAKYSRELIGWLRNNPDQTDLILRSQQDWDSLGSDEQRAVMWWNIDEANYYELVFMLWQEGLLDEQTYL